MNTSPNPASLPLRALALATALAVTGLGLVGVDGLARQRTVSPHAQIVQLDRVVVTGQRLTAASPGAVVVADAHCEAPARGVTPISC